MSSEQHICVHEREEHLKFPSTSIKLRKTTPIPVLDGAGNLLPATMEVPQLVKDADAILSTGHMSPPEITAVLRAANKMGLRRLVVNDPNFVIEANPAQAREWVDLGAVVEHGCPGPSGAWTQAPLVAACLELARPDAPGCAPPGQLATRLRRTHLPSHAAAPRVQGLGGGWG